MVARRLGGGTWMIATAIKLRSACRLLIGGTSHRQYPRLELHEPNFVLNIVQVDSRASHALRMYHRPFRKMSISIPLQSVHHCPRKASVVIIFERPATLSPCPREIQSFPCLRPRPFASLPAHCPIVPSRALYCQKPADVQRCTKRSCLDRKISMFALPNKIPQFHPPSAAHLESIPYPTTPFDMQLQHFLCHSTASSRGSNHRR